MIKPFRIPFILLRPEGAEIADAEIDIPPLLLILPKAAGEQETFRFHRLDAGFAVYVKK